MLSIQLPVQKYLREHTVGELENEFGVNVSVSRANPWKASLNYDMINSKPGELVNQCRGLILSVECGGWPTDKDTLRKYKPGDTYVMARGFDRFFNFGDPNAAAIDWRDPEFQVQTKLDGTLALVYFDFTLDKWCMATRSVPDADIPFGYFGGLMTFRELFDRAIFATTDLTLQEFGEHFDENTTIMFELTTPLNRIVVDYRDYSITWLGMRDNRDGTEFDYQTFAKRLESVNCRIPPCPSVFAHGNVDEIHAFLRDSNPSEIEGIVAVDSGFRRIKIKSAAWIEASKLKDACSSARNILAIVLRGADDDVIPFVSKEVIQEIDTLKTSFRRLEVTIDQASRSLLEAHPSDRKGYALAVTSSGVWPTPLFDSYTKKRSFREFVEGKRNADGSWPDGFLDTMLEQLAKFR